MISRTSLNMTGRLLVLSCDVSSPLGGGITGMIAIGSDGDGTGMVVCTVCPMSL